MEVRKPVLELKDVPPPPLHGTGSHPCLGPQTQPGSLSVSVCSRCAASVQLRQSAGLPLYLSPPHPSAAAQTPCGCGTHCCACALHSFPLGDPSSPPHLCPHSLHAHCLQDRWRKVCVFGSTLRSSGRDGMKHTCADPAVQSDTSLFCFQRDSEKVWPNIPPPVPVCNGCGDGLLGVRLGRTAQKYGQYLCCCCC